MYEAHFGLARPPFGETVSASAYVATPSRDAALRRMRYALEHSQGPAVLYGPPGSGKSLLATRLAAELGGKCVHVTFPAMSTADLVAYIAAEFEGTAISTSSLNAALRYLRDTFASLISRGERPLLVVDETHLIEGPAMFEALRLLLNFASDGPPDLSLLLVGDTELLLNMPAGLADRLAASCLLGAYSESESSTYIHGRLATAGARIPVFSPEALGAIHNAADGLPRRINHLADLALLIAYAQDHAIAGERDVQIAAREFNRDLAA